MKTSDSHHTTQTSRDRIAAILMLFSSAGALVAFVGSVSTVTTPGPDMQIVECWRMFGFLVFAGLFTLLAIRPRQYPGVWELVILHKLAMTFTGLSLLGANAAGARSAVFVDGILSILLIAAYILAKGYAGWSQLGLRKPK